MIPDIFNIIAEYIGNSITRKRGDIVFTNDTILFCSSSPVAVTKGKCEYWLEDSFTGFHSVNHTFVNECKSKVNWCGKHSRHIHKRNNSFHPRNLCKSPVLVGRQTFQGTKVKFYSLKKLFAYSIKHVYHNYNHHSHPELFRVFDDYVVKIQVRKNGLYITKHGLLLKGKNMIKCVKDDKVFGLYRDKGTEYYFNSNHSLIVKNRVCRVIQLKSFIKTFQFMYSLK